MLKHIEDISVIEDKYNQKIAKLKNKLNTLSEKDTDSTSKHLIDRLTKIIYNDENNNDEKIEDCKSTLEINSYILE